MALLLGEHSDVDWGAHCMYVSRAMPSVVVMVLNDPSPFTGLRTQKHLLVENL